MKATQTNMEESERDTERVNTEQEKDPDQPRLNEEFVPKRGATSVAWTWFGYEKSNADQKTVLRKVCRKLSPHQTQTPLSSYTSGSQPFLSKRPPDLTLILWRPPPQ